MRAGEQTNVSVPIGSTLTIPAGVGIGSIVRLSNPGYQPLTPVVYSGAQRVFGPFGDVATFRIICTAGDVNYIVAPVNGLVNVARYSKTVTQGFRSTVYVPIGAVLTVLAFEGGAGSLVPISSTGVGTPIPYTGAALSLGPFPDVRIFRIICTAGQIGVETGSIAPPQLTLSGLLAYNINDTSGTIATIGNVPSGVTPTFTATIAGLPLALGVLVLAGNEVSGWRIDKGLVAGVAGSVALTVSATGALSVTSTIAANATAIVALADFAANTYSGLFASSADVITLVSNSTRYAFNSDGSIVTVAANALRQTDMGIAVDNANTQAAANAYDLNSASWTVKTNVTINTAAYVGPDGVTQYSKMVPTLNGGVAVAHLEGRILTTTAGTLQCCDYEIEYDAAYPLAEISFDQISNASRRTAIVIDLANARIYDGPSKTSGNTPDFTNCRVTRLTDTRVLVQLLIAAASDATTVRMQYSPLPYSVFATPASNVIKLSATSIAFPTYIGDDVSGHRMWFNHYNNVDRIMPFRMGTAATTMDDVSLSATMLAALNLPQGALRLKVGKLFSPQDKTGLPLLVSGAGEVILSQYTDAAVMATIGGVSVNVQLGYGTWYSDTVDVVLAWSGNTVRLCANNGPVATMTATKPVYASAKLLQNVAGTSVTNGIIERIQFNNGAMTNAQLQSWSGGLDDPMGTFAYWHDSASIALSGGNLAVSTSVQGTGALTPAGGNEPAVEVDIDAFVKYIGFTGGKRASLPDPGLLDGVKKANFGFKIRPRSAATRNSEFGATNTVLAQGAFRIQENVDGLRVVVPHATTALIADFPKCHFTDDACCIEIRIDPAAATDAKKVRLWRNGVGPNGQPGTEWPQTTTQASAGAISAVTGSLTVGALSGGTEAGSFDLSALYAYAGATDGNRVHDMIQTRHYGQAARCHLVAGSDKFAAIFQGSDGNGLAPAYIDKTVINSTAPRSLRSYAGAGGDNKIVFPLFSGPTTHSAPGTDGITQAVLMAPRFHILTGLGMDTGLPIFAGSSIIYGVDSGSSPTRAAHHFAVEELGFTPSYHTAGANRIGMNGQTADCLSAGGNLPSASSNTFETAFGPEIGFFRKNLLMCSQDESMSIYNFARWMVLQGNLDLAHIIGNTGSPAAWYHNEPNHGYLGLVGFAADNNVAAEEFAMELTRRGREWDTYDIHNNIDNHGRQQNSVGIGQYSQTVGNGFFEFGSKGEHTSPPSTLIQNDVLVDAIGIVTRSGRASLLNQRAAIGNIWQATYVAGIATAMQGEAKVFLGGPVYSDVQPIGSVRTTSDNAESNAVHNSQFSNAPNFVQRSMLPPMLTNQMIRKRARERAGPNRMPAWVKARMDQIEKNEPYTTYGAVTSPYNDTTQYLGSGNTFIDPATFAANHLTPAGLAWDVPASAEIMLPWYRSMQDKMARIGDARFY